MRRSLDELRQLTSKAAKKADMALAAGDLRTYRVQRNEAARWRRRAEARMATEQRVRA